MLKGIHYHNFPSAYAILDDQGNGRRADSQKPPLPERRFGQYSSGRRIVVDDLSASVMTQTRSLASVSL